MSFFKKSRNELPTPPIGKWYELAGETFYGTSRGHLIGGISLVQNVWQVVVFGPVRLVNNRLWVTNDGPSLKIGVFADRESAMRGLERYGMSVMGWS